MSVEVLRELGRIVSPEVNVPVEVDDEEEEEEEDMRRPILAIAPGGVLEGSIAFQSVCKELGSCRQDGYVAWEHQHVMQRHSWADLSRLTTDRSPRDKAPRVGSGV